MYEFADHADRTYRAATALVPVITRLTGIPASVVDLGGGTGGWARAFLNAGTASVTCIDHPSVTPESLLVPATSFMPLDLAEGIPDPIPCDLSLSIEVAEHLPNVLSEAVVRFLTGSSDVVLFSAAVAGQRGHKHVNEQPLEYWVERFAWERFSLVDAIRPKILWDTSIPWWLRQNLVLFANAPGLDRLHEIPAGPFLPADFDLIHRTIREHRDQPTVGEAARLLAKAALQALHRRVAPSAPKTT